MKSAWHCLRWLSLSIYTTIRNITVGERYLSLQFDFAGQFLIIKIILLLLILLSEIHFYLWFLFCLFIKICVAEITVFKIRWWHKHLWLNLPYFLDLKALLLMLLLVLELNRVDPLNILSTKRHWGMNLSTLILAQYVKLSTANRHYGLISNCAIAFLTILIYISLLIFIRAFVLLLFILFRILPKSTMAF